MYYVCGRQVRDANQFKETVLTVPIDISLRGMILVGDLSL